MQASVTALRGRARVSRAGRVVLGKWTPLLYVGNMPAADIRVLDLFAGAGGLTAGFHQASDRFSSVAAVEYDLSAAASYEATFGEGIVYHGTIQDWLRTAEMPSDVDVVVGGPPCQGFSTLGKRQAEDERNSLWRQYAETLTRVQPKYFVVENVAAFAKSAQYNQFLEATQDGGFLSDYRFDFRVLNSADYGSPQARSRAVLLGHHRDLPAPQFPRASHSSRELNGLPRWRTVADALAEVPAMPDRDDVRTHVKTQYGGRSLLGSFTPRDLHWSRDYSDLSQRRFRAIPLGGNRFDLPDELLAECWKKHKTGSADVMGRLHWNKPSVTIRTEFFKPEKGRYLHPVEHRAITHYEAALLQGFPESHRFVGSRTAIAKQIGNAVPIALGSAIASSIASAIPN